MSSEKATAVMPEWKDISSFSRSETERTPKSWEIKLGTERLVVTRHVHYPKDSWVMQCMFLSEHELKSKDIDEAKREALGIFGKYLQKLVDDVEAMANLPKPPPQPGDWALLTGKIVWVDTKNVCVDFGDTCAVAPLSAIHPAPQPAKKGE